MRSLDDLTMFVYGFLDPSAEEAMKEHLGKCRACAHLTRRIAAEHRFFEGAFAREIPDTPTRTRATEAVLARRTGLRPLGWLRPLAAAAAGLCIVLLLSLSGSRPKAPDDGPIVAAAPPAEAPAMAPRRRDLLAYVQEPALGSLTARDELGRVVGELGLRSHEVRVEILDGVAKTTVEENFQNHTERRLEGTFRFPLPQDASISRLALEVNGKIEEGTCLERERAREVFQSIVNKARDPALLEWMGNGIFQCRIFPIEPRATKRVIIAYTQTLPLLRGRMTYVYPLASEKTAAHPPEELKIELQARCSGEIRKIECPTHAANVQRRNAREAAVAFSATNVRPKGDFVVALETTDDELRLIPHQPEGEDGYFALFVTPQGAAARVPAKYLLMVDVSASVTLPELEIERRLVRALMENRIPGDRFEILAVNIRSASSGEVDARGADAFLERLEPLGGLDLARAIRSAPEGDIVYIGRGIATYGETDPAKILEAAKGRRIRTISIGARANVDLLQRLGSHFRISPGDDVAGRVAEVAATLGSPAIPDLKLESADAIYDVVGIRPVFYGERLVVTGRYRPGSAKIVVSGQGFRRELEVALPAKEEGNNYVRRLWAQRQLSDLLALGPGVKEKITALGVKYQIMTPYTSFLVLENEQMWKDFQLQRTVDKQDHVLGSWIRDPQNPEPEAPKEISPDRWASPLGFTRFSLVSNGATQSIDLPRISTLEGRSYAEVRTTTNQFGGLEFTLGEAARVPVKGLPAGRLLRSDAQAIVVKHQPLSGPSSGAALPSRYTAKIEEGKTLNGIPLPPPFNPKNFWLHRELQKVVSRDAAGRPIGTLQFDPQANVFVVRDTKAVLDRIARILQERDVEPDTIMARVGDQTWALPVRPSSTEAVRRAGQQISLRFRNAPLAQIIEEFRRQLGWPLILPATSVPSDDRIDEFIVENESAYAALDALAAKAGLRVQEETDGLFVLTRPARRSLNVRDADVRTLLEMIAREAGVEINLAPGVKGNITVSLNNLPWDELLCSVARAAEAVAIRLGPSQIQVLHPDDALKQMDTRVYLVRYLTPWDEPGSELTQVLDALLTRDRDGKALGRIAAVESSRVYLILDNDAVKLRAQEILSYLDVAPGSTPALVELRQTWPPGIPALLAEVRERMAAPPGDARRDTELRLALRRLSVALMRFYGGGRMEAAMSAEGELAAGSDAGVAPGQFLAVTRGGEFRAIVRVAEASKDRAQTGVWNDLSVGRTAAGDRAERIRDIEAYLQTLPENIRKNLDSRRSATEIRAKMGARE